jgi:hypothetical protein
LLAWFGCGLCGMSQNVQHRSSRLKQGALKRLSHSPHFDGRKYKFGSASESHWWSAQPILLGIPSRILIKTLPVRPAHPREEQLARIAIEQVPDAPKRRHTRPALLLVGNQISPLYPRLLYTLIPFPKLVAIGACRQDGVQISLTLLGWLKCVHLLSVAGLKCRGSACSLL